MFFLCIFIAFYANYSFVAGALEQRLSRGLRGQADSDPDSSFCQNCLSK